MMPENVQNLHKPNIDKITEHLTFLFGDMTQGRIEVSTLTVSETFLTTEIHKAALRAESWNEQGKNVYVCGSLLKPDTFPSARGKDEDFFATSVLWCDLDEAFDPAKLKQLYKQCPPSISVITGRTPDIRAHLWWKLDTPCTDAAQVKDALKGIAGALGGDPAVTNPCRLMRIGGSVAWPTKDGRITETTEVKGVSDAKVCGIGKVLTSYPVNLSVANSNTVRNAFTGNVEITTMLEMSREDGKWNSSMCSVIASMVRRGWSDEMICVATDPYRRDRSLTDDLITPIIVSAREKYQVGDGEPVRTMEVEPDKEDADKTIHYVLAKDIKPSLDTNDFVQDIMAEGQFSVVYGESNCGKTFFMTDLAFHVAMGEQWRDKRVEQGGVIYVALEGAYGLVNRIAAYRQNNMILGKDMPFAMINSPIDFMNPKGNIDEFINLISTIEGDIGKTKLIVIDTLARALMGGDENSGQDMGMLVHHADKIKAHTGAHICFIHHSGKDTAKGARGHSSLRAAVDTEIEIHRDDGAAHSTIKVVKQREMEQSGEELGFGLKQVVLGQNKYDEDITSCVVEERVIEATVKRVTMNAMQQFIYDSIINALLDCGTVRTIDKDMSPVKCITYDELNDSLEANGYKELLATEKKTTAQQVKSATQYARMWLRKNNKIGFSGQYIWLIGDEND